MAGVEDEILVRRVATGDERALDGLYDRYSGLVYGAGTRYLGDRGMAEDLVQDVFLSVWRNAGSFDPSRASFALLEAPRPGREKSLVCMQETDKTKWSLSISTCSEEMSLFCSGRL